MYVFDTNSFVVIGHYFPDQFPSFWKKFNKSVKSGQIVSVREVFHELKHQARHAHLSEWLESNKSIFKKPTAEETQFVSEIFKVPHFLALVARKNLFKGSPVADPFVVAAARVNGWCVVTEENFKKDAAKIPNVCKHFNVRCINVEGFMKIEGWTF